MAISLPDGWFLPRPKALRLLHTTYKPPISKKEAGDWVLTGRVSLETQYHEVACVLYCGSEGCWKCNILSNQ